MEMNVNTENGTPVMDKSAALRENLQQYLIVKEVTETRPKTPGALKELKALKKRKKDDVSYEDKGTHYVVNLKLRLARMFVKPFTQDGITDLESLMNNPKVQEKVEIERKDGGTYCITARWEIYTIGDFFENFWGMLFRKFQAQASVLATNYDVGGYSKQNICWSDNDIGMEVSEEDKDKYFYIITLSPVLIEAASLPRFQLSQCA